MNNTIGIYPYTHDWKPILHYKEFLFPGISVYASVKSLEPNMESYQSEIVPYPQCPFDTLMLTEGFESRNIDKEILEFIEHGINIENFHTLTPEIIHRLEKNKNFKNYLKESTLKISGNLSTLSDIPVPVIFVLSLYEDLDKFAVQVALRKILMNRAIIVSQIGTRPYCERFGFHSFPVFMYQNLYTPEEKIFLFNQYVNKMVKEERPEVIIIGIPGAYNKFNKDHPMGFGVLPYLISQAVIPDFSIMCTFYTELESEKFLKDLSENCMHRLGFEIDCFHMSGTYIDMNVVNELNQIKYTHMSDKIVEKVIKSKFNKFDTCVFNIYNINGEKALGEKLFTVLSSTYEEIDVSW